MGSVQRSSANAAELVVVHEGLRAPLLRIEGRCYLRTLLPLSSITSLSLVTCEDTLLTLLFSLTLLLKRRFSRTAAPRKPSPRQPLQLPTLPGNGCPTFGKQSLKVPELQLWHFYSTFRLDRANTY